MGGFLGKHLERESLQSVACQDGCRFIEGAMCGRFATAEVIIVHGRQVVMHQRVGVEHFDRGADAGRAGFGGAEEGGDLHDQEAAQALAAAEGTA